MTRPKAPDAPRVADDDRDSPNSGRGRRAARVPRSQRRAEDLAASHRGGGTLRRRTRLRRLVGVVLAVAILATGAGWLVLASPWLRVRTVTVTGIEEPQKSEIQQVANAWVDEPLVKVDTSRLRDEIADMRVVSRVDIARQWPDALVVAVAPRTPVAAAVNPQGVLELVDAEGLRYASVDQAPAGIPTVTLAHADAPAEVASAVAVLTALDAGQRDSATDFRVASPEDVRFRMDDVLILWGGPSDGKVKAAVVAALVHREGVGTVNVSAPNAPVVTMGNAASPSRQG